jgi:hypothetical protein
MQKDYIRIRKSRRILIKRIERRVQNMSPYTCKTKWRFPVYMPGDEVPVSGVYNIVDREGRPTGYQRIEARHGVFGPDPRGAGFKLRRLI